jgi:LmbE family N-acetylglucosaminyl deacetylase
MQPEDYFAGHPDARAVFEKVRAVLSRLGPVEVRASKSQVAFRRRRGFAFLWLPGRYLSKPTAEVVLSIGLGRHDPSARFKEVAHPAPAQWMHHLEIHDIGDIDDEVVGWLQEAADRASG